MRRLCRVAGIIIIFFIRCFLLGYGQSTTAHVATDADATTSSTGTRIWRPGLRSTTTTSRREEGRNLQATVREFHVRFGYQFFFTLTESPSQEHINNMLCETQRKITEDLTPQFGNECLELFMTEMSWQFVPDGDQWQFLMNSFVSRRSVDGGFIPSYAELLAVWQENFIPQDYITSYLWEAEPRRQNIFYETQVVFFATEQLTRTPGLLAAIDFDCPNNPPPPECETLPPTVFVSPAPSSTPTTSPTEAPTTNVPSQVPSSAPSHPPTEFPTTSPSQIPTPIPSVTLSHPPSEMPTDSPSQSPSEMPTNSPSRTLSELPTNSPSQSPTAIPTVSPSHPPSEMLTNSPSQSPTELPTSVPTEPIPSDSPSTTPTFNPTPTMPSHTPSLVPTSALTVPLSDDTVKSMFILQFAFYEGLAREPTDEEVQSVLCLTDIYFFNLFRRIFRDNDMTYDSVNVNWTWNETDPLPLTIIMGANVTYGDGSKPPVVDIINLFDERKNLTIYVDNYVKDVPELESVFYQTDYVEFEGIDQVVSVENAKIPSVAELCAPSPFDILGGVIVPGDFGGGNPDDTATVVLDVDLQDDVARNSNRDLSNDEIQGLGCEINRYLRDILSPYTNATEVSLHAIDIDWTYTPGASEPVAVSFTINSTITDDGEQWPSAVQIVEIWNNHFDAEVFLSNYVRQSEPHESSIFSDAQGTDYSVEVTDDEDSKIGRISDTEDCGQTTHSPLAKFQIDFAFFGLSDIRRLEEEATIVVRPPTTDEVQGLACQTNLYFKEILADVLPGEYFSIEMVGVDWMFDPSYDFPLRVVFHSRSTDIDGMPFPLNSFINEVFRLRFEKNRYIEQFVWKSEPQEESLFFQTEDVKWDFTIRSPGVNRLPTGVCPAATQPPLPTLSVDFGFFDDDEDSGENLERLPTATEIEGLMCETTDYIGDILAVEYPGESFTISAVSIDWDYAEGLAQPVVVTFSAETKLENGTLFPPADEMVALLNRTFDMDTYIREYVWKSQSMNENMFYETETISWDIEERVPDGSAQLPKAKCDDGNDDDTLNPNDDDDGNGSGSGNGNDDGSGSGNGNGSGNRNGDDDGNGSGNGLGGDGIADRDRGLDWWHWLLIILYILFVICLICTLLQCYYYLLSHYDEDDLVEEDPPKERDIMTPLVEEPVVEEPVDEDEIYGPRDPKGQHIDRLAPLLPIKEASQSGYERDDDTEKDLIDLKSDEDEDEDIEQELYAGDEEQEDNLIDTLSVGEAYEEDGIDNEESSRNEDGANYYDMNEDDARGQHTDIRAPVVTPADVDGPVIANRDFVESENKDEDEESEVSLDPSEIFRRSSSDESYDDEEYDSDSFGSSTDEHSYEEDDHGSDEEWEDEDSSYSGEAESFHDELEDAPESQGDRPNLEDTVRRSNRQLDLASGEDDWQDEEALILDEKNEEQVAGDEYDELEADRTLDDMTDSWEGSSVGSGEEQDEIKKGIAENDNESTGDQGDDNQRSSDDEWEDDPFDDGDEQDMEDTTRQTLDRGDSDGQGNDTNYQNKLIGEEDDGQRPELNDEEWENDEAKNATPWVEDDASDGGSWEDAEGDEAGLETAHVSSQTQEHDNLELDGDSWEGGEGNEHDVAIHEADANENGDATKSSGELDNASQNSEAEWEDEQSGEFVDDSDSY